MEDKGISNGIIKDDSKDYIYKLMYSRKMINYDAIEEDTAGILFWEELTLEQKIDFLVIAMGYSKHIAEGTIKINDDILNYIGAENMLMDLRKEKND